VVTDVGDSAEIVGDTGVVVPPGDAGALAAALERVLGMTEDERTRMGQRARIRVQRMYSIGAVSDQYLAAWRDVQAKISVPRKCSKQARVRGA
jgi:glycosyltransferase involved in cell wall biosynthesis